MFLKYNEIQKQSINILLTHFAKLRFISVEWLCRQRGQFVKSFVIVIDMVLVQNPLAPFCCVLGKDTLQYVLLVAGVSKQF